MSKPRLFIGSSAENLSIAHAVQENLEQDAEVVVWDQGIFDLSKYTLEALLQELDKADFAVFIFAPNDITRIRDEYRRTVRDNVLFELGLFVGRLGRERCFIVQPRGIKDQRIPSDLFGLTAAEYDPNRSDGNLKAALGPACNKIRRCLCSTAKTNNEKWMDWSTYYSALLTLKEQIAKKPELGGYRPHLVVGVNQGGAIVGGFLHYFLLRSFHFTVWTYDDWKTRTVDTHKRELIQLMQSRAKLPKFEKFRILLIDDSFKTGTSMGRVRSLVDEVVKELRIRAQTEIKAAVIVYRSDLWDRSKGPCPDYYVYQDYTHFPYGDV